MDYKTAVKSLTQGKPLIVQLKEKHGDWVYLLEDEEDLHNLIGSLIDSRKDYYPREPKPPTKPAISKEDGGDLPSMAARAAVEREWEEYERAFRRYEDELEQWGWVQRTLYDGDFPAGYWMLQRRADYEYEGFEVEQAQKPTKFKLKKRKKPK
jgi:hypothetical protein